MAVKGDLAYQGLDDLLQADLASQGGGRLTLRHGAHHAALYLGSDGLVMLAPDVLEAGMLLEGFVERGLLPPGVLERMREGRESPKRLLDMLVADGSLPAPELHEVIAAEIEDAILDLMLWEEGVYRFEREPAPAGATGPLSTLTVDPEGVLQRALARLEERRAIGDRLGDHAILFEPVAGELPPLDGPEDRLHEIYTRVDGRTVVHEMALRMGLSRFVVLQGLARLHESGLVRAVAPEELVRAATERAEEGRRDLACALVRQWAEDCPDDPSPLRKLASLAHDAGNKDAELEAMCAQGHLFIRQGDPGEALEIFTRAMRQAPADDVVLAGLRLAAQGAGDGDALVDGTLLTAQTKLDEGEPEAALEMLEPLLASHPDHMAVHLLRARALVLGERRSEFFEQAEVVGQVLSRGGVKSDTDRQVAEYFRETIAHLAPDRGDLLERFRLLYDPRRRRRRSLALASALLLVVAGAGVYFWPVSAATLLTRAQEAADAGDKERALEMIGQLVDRHPDSPEADEAVRMQARLFPPTAASTRTRDARKEIGKDLADDLAGLGDALAALPAVEGRRRIQAVLEPLGAPEAKPLRAQLLADWVEPLAQRTDALHGEVVERVQVLGTIGGAPERFAEDTGALGAYIELATAHRDAGWIRDVQAAAASLHALAKLSGDAELVRRTQALARASQGLDKAATYFDEHLGAARIAFARRQFEAADLRCREDAPKLMVNGRLDEADACYARLEGLLERYGRDELFSGLLMALKRRKVPAFVQERRGQIRDIRRRLARAQDAEDDGNLEAAIAIYTALVKEYWLIRFENICTLPVRVETTPPGATVLVDGRPVGSTPVIVRYAWGGETTLRVESEGFAPKDIALETAAETPASVLPVRLDPAPAWTSAAPTREGPRPLPLGKHVLAVDRQGVLTLLDGADGTTVWRRDLSSLEGVRARPVLVGDVLYVARVDGQCFRVDVATGKVLGTLDLPRPTGDLATDGVHVALTTTERELILVKEGAVLRRDDLGTVPTAGILAAHGAFWLGTADGTVLRVDTASGATQVVPCARGTASIVALAAAPDGMLVTTSDRGLIALDPRGETRWSRAAVGDLVGTPASCGDTVAVVDRAGVVHVFSGADGEAARTIPTGHAPADGVLAVGTSLLVIGQDGVLRAVDPRSGLRLLTHDTGERPPPFAPAALGETGALVPFGAGRAARITVPQQRR